METIKNFLSKFILFASAEEKNFLRTLDLSILSVLFLSFFLLPVFFLGKTTQGAGFEKFSLFYFLTFLGSAAWMLKGFLSGGLRLKKTPLDIPVLGFLAVFSISALSSVGRAESLLSSYGSPGKGLLAVVAGVLFYYLLINNAGRGKLKLLIGALASSSFILIIFEAFRLSFLPAARGISSAPLSSWSGLAMFLLAMLPIFTVILTQPTEILPESSKPAVATARILAVAAVLGDLFVLFLLSGFTFWPAGIAGAAIILMFYLTKTVKISGKDLTVPAIVFLLLVASMVVGGLRPARLKLPAEVSLSRNISWQVARRALKENPIFGSGPSTFYYDFDKFRPAEFNSSPLWDTGFNDASGLFLEALATIGIAGSLFLLILMTKSGSLLYDSLSRARGSRSLLLGFFSSFFSIIILTAAFYADPSFLLLSFLILCLGLALAASHSKRVKTVSLNLNLGRGSLAPASLLLSVGVGSLILLALAAKISAADALAMRALGQTEMEAKISDIRSAAGLDPYSDAYLISLADLLAAKAQGEEKGGESGAAGNDYALALAAGKKAIGLAPQKSDDLEAVAMIYESSPLIDPGVSEAGRLYLKSRTLSPSSPSPLLHLALNEMKASQATSDPAARKNHYAAAESDLDEAIALKSDFAAAYYTRSAVYEKQGKLDKAIDDMEKAYTFVPDNLNYGFKLGQLYLSRGGAADLPLAERIFLSVLASIPGQPDSLYDLAKIYQKEGDKNKEKIYLDRLLSLLPEAAQAAVKKEFPEIK